MKRALAWTALVAAVIAILAVGGLIVLRPRPAPTGQSIATGPQIGGDFHLVDQAGKLTTQELLRGKWTAVFFGYTSCPDVCPTTLAALGQISEALGPDQRRFQVVFVTVDPARDTSKVLARYLASSSFPRNVIGLTGTAEAIAQIARAYRVFYQKVPQGGTYVMDHTAVIYLMDPAGRFVAPLDISAPPDKAAAVLRDDMARS